jgi:signal transduction histidine kinase
MVNSGPHFDILIIFFIYGLGFFAMGLALALEVRQSPTLASANLLIPLAGFGLLHGLHEWFEIYLLQLGWLGVEVPIGLSILRLTLLTISFVLLILFGLQTRQGTRSIFQRKNLPGIVFLGLYIVLIIFSAVSAYESGTIPPMRLADALVRYLLAVTGAALAFLGLNSQSKEFRSADRLALSKNINLAAIGFGIYAITQFFVPSVDMFPARWINSDVFSEVLGFPIQLIRAAMALIIMTGMLKATTLVHKERETQLLNAQKARMNALEQIQRELTERENLRRELLRHTVHAQEDERARIARELHDETSQVLSAFSLDLATLRQLSSRRKDITMLVDRLQNLGKQMSQGIFRLVHDLRPAQLDDLGLASALRYLTERENYPNGIRIALEVVGLERRLDPITETVLFRVAQESIANIRKHARVENAQMRLLYEEDQVTLWIEDQGVGFNPEDTFSPPRGWGLAGMKERIDSISGLLNILSAHGKGTIIEVIIPSEPGNSKQGDG